MFKAAILHLGAESQSSACIWASLKPIQRKSNYQFHGSMLKFSS